MKQVYLGAAALLLGTSALAFAKSPEPAGGLADKGIKAMAIGEKTFELAKPVIEVAKPDADVVKPLSWTKDGKDEAKVVPAAASWWSDDMASKTAKEGPKLEPTAAAAWADDEAVILAKKGEGNPDLDLAVKPDDVQPDQVGTGVGGPLEEVDTAAVSPSDLTPRPATRNYPPCDPGPGDDNCIQLYEPGVRAALASWNPPADTGMGGPYEPVNASVDTATVTTMAGDGHVDGALGEVLDDETLAASSAGAGAGAETYAGMGGPLEEVTPVKASGDYPPCRPGPGDDRCIQLYERGVG